MTSITTGLYRSPSEAANAVRFLEARGVLPEDINLIASDDFDKDGFTLEAHSKAPEGIAVGAATGGTVGALIAGLTAVGAIATGGAGLGLLVAGPVVAALAGAGAGAVAGGVVGSMIGAAVPEHEVKYYEDAIKGGSVLIGVKTTDRTNKKLVKSVMEAAGAEKISHA
ncbi:MAG: hypothetical protein H7Y02_03985 [Candidatus Obscuribacterales bacterium]|nr:hypothetical protein [Steroidobacteraceae bacterium]